MWCRGRWISSMKKNAPFEEWNMWCRGGGWWISSSQWDWSGWRRKDVVQWKAGLFKWRRQVPCLKGEMRWSGETDWGRELHWRRGDELKNDMDMLGGRKGDGYVVSRGQVGRSPMWRGKREASPRARWTDLPWETDLNRWCDSCGSRQWLFVWSLLLSSTVLCCGVLGCGRRWAKTVENFWFWRKKKKTGGRRWKLFMGLNYASGDCTAACEESYSGIQCQLMYWRQ